MPKKGNWGDWAVIDLPPIEVKYVSCYACRYYYEEDGSCIKTSIIPSKDGNKILWKNCSYFELDSEYMTTDFIKTVKKVKGADFFSTREKHLQNKTNVRKSGTEPLICDLEIGTWIKSDKFGTGKLLEAYPGKIVIDFNGKYRTFLYPESFDNCLLFLVYPPTENENNDNVIEISTVDVLDSDIAVVADEKAIVSVEQSSDVDNIDLDKSDSDIEDEDSNDVPKCEDIGNGSSFIRRIIGRVKSLFNR